jgi:hypothetical protein
LDCNLEIIAPTGMDSFVSISIVDDPKGNRKYEIELLRFSAEGIFNF